MPDSRRSRVGAIAVSFSLSVAALLPVTAQAVSDEVAVELLQRLDQLENEVRDLRGENEQLRDRLSQLPEGSAESGAPADAGIPQLNLSLPEVAAEVTASAVVADNPEVQAEVQTGETPEVRVSSDAAEPVSVASTPERDNAAAVDAVAADADASDDKTKTDTTDTLLADLKKESAQDNGKRVDPDSPDSYFTYGEKGRQAVMQADAKAIPVPKPEATVTIARTNSTDGATTSSEGATEKATTPQGADDSEKKARMAYNDAYKLVRQSPADAVTSFRNFLNNYPDHRLAGNAQYWLGESLYTQKDYSGASVEFMKVLKQHKDSDKAPGAALKLGFSFYELRQWELARRTLEDTRRFFPNNSVAQLAQSRLTKMDAEGR